MKAFALALFALLVAMPAAAEVLHANPWSTKTVLCWTPNLGGTIVVKEDSPDPTLSGGQRKVIQYTYPAGFEGGRSPGFQEYKNCTLTGHEELYFGGWGMFSASWKWSNPPVDSTGTKLQYIYLRHSGTGAFARSGFSVAINKSVWGGPGFQFSWQPNFGVGTKNYGPNACAGCANPLITLGAWHWFEVRIKLNTATTDPALYSSDGILELWLDGQKVASHTRIAFRDVSAYTFYIYKDYSSWNSSTSQVVPATQWLWRDLTSFSTTYMGPPNEPPPPLPVPTAPSGLTLTDP